MPSDEPLLPQHGGYRKLKTFQLSQLVYDLTVRFCELYIDRRSRTHDQMVQAARSGVQNIAEGSLASATSKKTELKLTNVGKASLGELQLDYEDFLRQHNLPLLAWDDPALQRFKARRCSTLEDVRLWAEEERNASLASGVMPPLASSTLVANAALSLLNLCTHLLGKQIAAQAAAFEAEGGFTERLYRVRSAKRNKQQ